MPTTTPPAPPIDASLIARLQAAGQSHLLRFAPTLTPDRRAALLAQIEALDLSAIPSLVETYVKSKPTFLLPASVEPAPYYPNNHASKSRAWDRARFEKAGQDLIRAGRVACFTVAGGQGTRLGYDGPKGCYPAGAVSRKPLFQLFAEQILAHSRRSGKDVPWYVMTSPLNHDATVAFFRANDFFGLPPSSVMCFPQGVMPSFDMKTGRVLLAAPGEIATNPDGHGGSITALHRSGAIADMKRRGITTLSYFQVDNATVQALDPAFLGLHASAPDSSAEMSSKMIPKAYAEEKLGLFCSCNGRTEVIEYSDLPMDLQRQTLPDGTLRFLAGSIAVHAMSVEFIERLATDPRFSLPYHRAEKKVPCIDPETGEKVDPASPNGVKLERFVFDALPLCRASIVYETDRIEEFAPIKNAAGVDSPESCTRLQTERAARWLKAAGIEAPRTSDGKPDCTLEISASTALCASDLVSTDAGRAAVTRLRSSPIPRGANILI